MEELVKVVTKYSYDEYKKLNKFHMRSRKKGPTIFLYTCCAIIFLVSILLIILGEPVQGICYMVFSVLMIVFILFMPTIATKRIMKSDKIISDTVSTIIFYDEYIDAKTDQSEARLYYDQIYEAYETDENFYIYINRASAHIISKNGIEVGNAQVLRELLTKKLDKKFKVK